MARLGTAYLYPIGGGTPLAQAEGGATGDIHCTCPAGISAGGSVELIGTPGESLTGWALGFFQLKFINTNYARYRGAAVSDGSLIVSKSNQILSRDTDEASPELWYDPISWGIHGARGTRVLAAGTVVPATGPFSLSAGFWDSPDRFFDAVVKNTTTNKDNFIYHVDVGLQFCTLLVARDPSNHYTFLKHFYWNVRWEAYFERDAAGVPRMKRQVHMQLNIQHSVHSGVPNDARFRGRESDATLPVSSTITNRAPRLQYARDWALG